MINVKSDVREKCKYDTAILLKTLEEELKRRINGLVTAPQESVPSLQGYAQALQDVIKLLK